MNLPNQRIASAPSFDFESVMILNLSDNCPRAAGGQARAQGLRASHQQLPQNHLLKIILTVPLLVGKPTNFPALVLS
jgi:hypothetical protein